MCYAGGWEGLSKDLLSPPAETFQIRVGVTRRRLNRWAYLQDGGGGGGGNAAERSGTLTTRAAMATARTELALNADISAGGSIRVEALGREWLLRVMVEFRCCYSLGLVLWWRRVKPSVST
jgi:hypothetical protein